MRTGTLMPLRVKLTSIETAVFGVFVIAIVLILSGVIFPDYLTIEDNFGRSRLQNCLREIENEIEHLGFFVRDWAEWDDMYQYSIDLNDDFVTNNLNDRVMETAHLNLVLIVAQTGDVVWRKSIVFPSGESLAIPELEVESFSADRPVMDLINTGGSLSGLLWTERGVMLVAAHGITSTDGAKSNSGILVLGRLLDLKTVDRVEDRGMFPLLISPLAATDTAQFPVRDWTGDRNSYDVRVLDGDRQEVSIAIDNVFRTSKIRIAIQLERMMYKQAVRIVAFAGFSVLAVGVLMLIVMREFIQRLVARPIGLLTDVVSNVEAKEETLKTIAQTGNDEIGVLAERFHTLFQNLKESQTELKRKSEYYERLSKLDGLTHLPNRRCFDEYMHKVWSRSVRHAVPLSVAIGDLDYFKGFNDTYGHQAGDECLQQVARIIQRTLKRPDDFCARYGGEEFVVVMPWTSLADARRLIETMREEIVRANVPHAASKCHSVVTASFGVAEITPTRETSLHQFLEAVDAALYRAKQSGRNQVFALPSPSLVTNPLPETMA